MKLPLATAAMLFLSVAAVLLFTVARRTSPEWESSGIIEFNGESGPLNAPLTAPAAAEWAPRALTVPALTPVATKLNLYPGDKRPGQRLQHRGATPSPPGPLNVLVH